jgi:hypothetical protein
MIEATQRAKNEAEKARIDWAKLTAAEKKLRVDTQLALELEQGRNSRHSSVSGSTAYASDSATARAREGRAEREEREAGNLGTIVTTQDAVAPIEAGWFSPAVAGTPATRTTRPIRATQDKLVTRPMPKTQDKLVTDAVYATANGDARWNGSAFELIE